MANSFGKRPCPFVTCALFASATVLSHAVLTSGAMAQSAALAGSITGTISDPDGAVIPGATIHIVGKETNFQRDVKTDSQGNYASGALNPGTYLLSVQGSGFAKLEATTIVKLGTVTNGNFKLTAGGVGDTTTVSAESVQVNTDQAAVQGTVSQEQIKTLPVQGRNFLDLAQLQPGVQLQNGENFDPTKAGYSAVSIDSVSGRATRILLDGQDITDEMVGTTVVNVPSGAVSEFQLNRSTADVAGEKSSSGSVTVATPSGTNEIHGQLFYQFQDHGVGFARTAYGIDAPFQRNQFGGNIGGPILKDKLFAFVDVERIKQDSSTSAVLGNLFANIQKQYPTYSAPFRDTYSVLRLDYNAPHGIHLFGRANYEVNSAATNGGQGYSVYANRDNTPGFAFGADFVTGKFTHSLRTSYQKFHNIIKDAATGNPGLYDPLPSVSIAFPTQNLYAGPNGLAPQQTYQSDKQYRYDGSWVKGNHSVRFGASINRIQSGLFYAPGSLGPQVTLTSSSYVGGAVNDPLSYAPTGATIANAEGFYSEHPGFGMPAGTLSDWRLGIYLADSWKVSPSLSLSYGMRYSRDTGRQESDLAPVPCSSVVISAYGYTPCSGSANLLDQYGAGLGDRVRQPNFDLGPQVAFVYSPGGNGKTSFRGAIGLYYENIIFVNSLGDRPWRLQTGLFSNSQPLCGGVTSLPNPTGGPAFTSYNGESYGAICNQALSASGPKLAAIQQQYQAAVSAVGQASNPNFVGQLLQISGFAYDPHRFSTPRSMHINFGMQRELFRGGVLSVDYIHQAGSHFMQNVDANRVGDARFFSSTAAKAAVAATLAACGVSNVDAAITSCPGLYPNGDGATIDDFAGNGLDSGTAYNGGRPSPGNIAFAGKNPLMGTGTFAVPTGRSAFDALQFDFRQQSSHPAPGLASSNLEVSYSYSRFVQNTSNGGSDQFVNGGVWDENDTSLFFGPGGLDRTHQLSVGGAVTVAHGPVIGLIAHYFTSPPTSLTLDNSSGNTAQIFKTDWTGDGQAGDILPGTLPGDFMRRFTGSTVNRAIDDYNAKYAGTLTPAGKALVNSGIFTSSQMTSLGATMPTVARAPQHAAQNGTFKSLDLNVSYPIHVRRLGSQFSLEPQVAMYNVPNFANFGGPNGQLQGVSGTINGTTNSFLDRNQFRTTRGSGTYNQGAPRTTEFILKLNF